MDERKIAKIRWFYEQEIKKAEVQEVQTTHEDLKTEYRGIRKGIRRCLKIFNDVIENG